MSMKSRATGAGSGAPPEKTARSVRASYVLRVSAGRSSTRWSMVGTIALVVMP